MKTDYSKIHPELRQLARTSPKFILNIRMLWLLNVLMRLMPKPKPPETVRVENVFIERQDDQTPLRLRIYKPKTVTSPTPALIWLHGGGYVMGTPEMDDRICAEYVRELGITVLSVNYRLAPKHPFPAGLEDSYAALIWAASHAEQMGINANRIAIGGASAGGGLAAALVQFAHDQHEITPIFQLLVYPMLDDRTALRADLDDSNNITWNQKNNRFGWESYLGAKWGAKDLPAYAVPARRDDLSALPAAWVGVGELDLFHDEDVAYAHRLKACGVACELEVVPGAYHGFDVFDFGVPIVQKFHQSQFSALRHHLF
jgi:acetyl esterase/lipase